VVNLERWGPQLKARNLTADKVVYLRYIRWRDQVSLESYQGLRKVDDAENDESAILPLDFHRTRGGPSDYLDYFIGRMVFHQTV